MQKTCLSERHEDLNPTHTDEENEGFFSSTDQLPLQSSDAVRLY
jgi:hypothetical protein